MVVEIGATEVLCGKFGGQLWCENKGREVGVRNPALAQEVDWYSDASDEGIAAGQITEHHGARQRIGAELVAREARLGADEIRNDEQCADGSLYLLDMVVGRHPRNGVEEALSVEAGAFPSSFEQTVVAVPVAHQGDKDVFGRVLRQNAP